MTEQDDIKRLTAVMDKLLLDYSYGDYPYGPDLKGEQIAKIAHAEMKSIQREKQAPRQSLAATIEKELQSVHLDQPGLAIVPMDEGPEAA